MKKVSVTYHAPKGDNKVCEAFGHTFFDGKAEEVTVEDAVFNKLSNNANFECGKATDITPAEAAKEAAAKKPKEPEAKSKEPPPEHEHKGR